MPSHNKSIKLHHFFSMLTKFCSEIDMNVHHIFIYIYISFVFQIFLKYVF